MRGRAVVEGVDVGEQHERVGADQVGHEGREPVVVAEADLVGGDRVVFVDDGHHAEVEQPVEGAQGVGVLAAAHEVFGGEEHLADGDAVGSEGVRVAGHQQALAHARGGLLGGEVAGTLREPERGEPGGDRAGGHQDDLRAGVALVREGVGEVGQGLFRDAALDGGQRRRSDLDHDPARPGQHGPVGGRPVRGRAAVRGDRRTAFSDGFTRHLLRPVHSP